MARSRPADRLLQVASRLFFERGYAAVGINQIIREAQSAKASFYQYYPSKEALGVAWLEQAQAAAGARQADLLAERGDPARRIQRYFRELGVAAVAPAFRGCPFANTAAGLPPGPSPLRARIEDEAAARRAFFVALAEPVAGPLLAGELAAGLDLLAAGARLLAQNRRSRDPFDEAAEAAARLTEAAAGRGVQWL